MTWHVDARIAVELSGERIVPAAAPRAAVVEAGVPTPDNMAYVAMFDPAADIHPAGCSCCGARNSAAQAFDRVFLARARGQAPWFTRVVAIARTAQAAELVRDAVRDDQATRARFRMES